MEQQILKAINHIKYVSKKGVTIQSVYKDSWKKIYHHLWRNLFERNYMRMQQNGKIDGKFKIINPIYEDKNFVEDPLEIYPKTCNNKSYIPEESVNTTLTL